MRYTLIITAVSSVMGSIQTASATEHCPDATSKLSGGPEANHIYIGPNANPLSGDITNISKGNDEGQSLLWNGRFHRDIIIDAARHTRPDDHWSSIRILVDNSAKTLTFRIETPNSHHVSGPIYYNKGQGFTYVETDKGSVSACVKLPGFVPPT